MGLDLSSFGNLTSNLGSLVPSSGAIIQQVALGAAASVVLKGLQAGGAQQLDPLGLFHPKGEAAAPIAATNNPAITSGPTITASAFASLPPASQSMMLASGVHVIAG